MNMAQVITILISTIFIENIILSQFLGICSFLGVSKKRSSAIGMSISVLVVIILATLVTWLLYNYVLVVFDLVYLKTIIFILVIASLVQIIEIIIKKFAPSLYKSLGIYLPLITTNCAILGIALKTVNYGYGFGTMLLYAIGSGIGYFVVMYIFSVIREELEQRNLPKAMKGIPIALVVASILAILFSRYVGIAPKVEDEEEALRETYVIENDIVEDENIIYYDHNYEDLNI